jgi:hypothetical protein
VCVDGLSPTINFAGMVKVDIPSHLRGDEWRRMPKPKERLCGLSRTTILELSNAGLIKTVAIRNPGAVKGIRLVFMPSLLEYLEKLAK